MLVLFICKEILDSTFFPENFSYILNSTRMDKNYLGNKDNNFFLITSFFYTFLFQD